MDLPIQGSLTREDNLKITEHTQARIQSKISGGGGGKGAGPKA